jgi:outer membrane immunogenic protein
MKKLLLACATAVALIAANAASAADMGLPVKGRALEPEWNWSGFYAGLNAGYARGTTVWNDLDGALNSVGGTFANESANGFIGGGQIGYNWQFRHAVFGLEADFDYLSLDRTTTLLDLSGAGGTADHLRDAIRWLGTVRGRAGLALDNVLFYLTAGLAYGQTDHSVTSSVNGSPGLSETHDFNAFKVGPVAGGGIEFGLDPRWSVKAEALYVDLGRHTGVIHGDNIALSRTVVGRLETLDTMWIVRAGVNYRFGG